MAFNVTGNIRRGNNWNSRIEPGCDGLAHHDKGFGSVKPGQIFKQMNGKIMIGNWRLYRSEKTLGQGDQKETAVIIQKGDNKALNKDRTVAIRSGIGFRSSFSYRTEWIWRLTGDKKGGRWVLDHSQVSSSKVWMADIAGRQAERRWFWREAESNLSLRWLEGMWMRCLAKGWKRGSGTQERSWMQI